MHFQRFLRSKRAQEGQTTEVPKAARGILIGGLFVLVIISIMMKSGTIFGAEGGEGTAEFFDRFALQLRLVANGTKDRALIETAAIGSNEYLLAAFDKDPFLDDTCQGNEKFWKPQQCEGKMCICICNEDDACKEPVDCRIIESKTVTEFTGEPNDKFDANLGKAYGGDKADVLIYADCDGWGGEPLGIRDLLIEKEGDKTVRISDNACANKKFRGKKGKCTKILQGQPSCGPGESPLLEEGYKCGEGFTCCI